MQGNVFKKMAAVVEEKKEEESKWLDPKSNKFSYESLAHSFPEGVDPTRKEAYLSDEEFVKVFGMTAHKFVELKKWRQNDLKKSKELF